MLVSKLNWLLDYLDENGEPLPALPVNEVVQSMREESSRESVSQSVGSTESNPVRITYV